NNVTVNNSVAVQKGATLNNVTINEANGYYGLWINANGQSVTMNGGAINATNGGRGIKIADQYVGDAVASVTLSITDTVFNTAKKAAVLVTSPKGANITASNLDITNVKADSVNAIWVDEDTAANYGKVEVTGATVAQESIEEFVASVIVNGKVEGYYKTLAEALAALKAGDTLTLLADAEINTSIVVTSDLTIDGNGHKITVTGAYGIDIQAAEVDLVINNLTIESNLYALNMRGVSDNSTVEINDSNLTGCIALNVWGENVVITANNSNFTSVDKATHENYSAVVLNNNGSVSAEGTVITIKGGTITALDENGKPSIAATNATATGVINISNETVVTGTIEEIVAIVTYNGYSEFYSCFTLQAAIDRAANDATATVKLLRNITVNEALVINGNVVIDGNGKTLTYTGKARAIDVPNTVANANVTIKNLTIDFTSGYSERGINYNTNGTLTLDNVTINGKDVTYAVNFPGSSNDAKVVINNSNIIGKIALNVWGKNMTITVTDTALTSVDNATHENYAAVALNNNGSVSAEGTVITIKGGSITALDENKNPSIAVRNATATGVINISNETVVTGTIEEIVAIVTYNGYSEFYSCFTLQAAIDRAANDATATVKLLCDITVDEALVINGKVVIDLNGKTVTSTAKRAFEVYADATIKNGTIVGANRCVDTRTAVKLTLEDLALVAENYTSSYGNPQPLTIGGSVNGTEVTMSNVNINAGKSGYGIISFVKTELTATNSTTISGYSALYVKAGSEGSEFTFEGCTLTGDNTNNDVEGNSFGAIALQASDITVTVDANSTVTANGNNMYAIAVGSTSIDVTGNTVTVSGTINGNIIATDDYDNTVKVKAEYADELVNAGYSASEADKNGLVTVEKDEIPTLTKAETALLLEENFKMSFYFPVDQFVDGVNYFAMITKHHVGTCGDPDEITYVAIDMTKIYDADNYGASYRVVAEDIAAKEMNCEISCQVFAGEMPENVNDENTAVSIGTVKDSIYEYAMWQLENSNDEKLKALIVDVLNYGAAAQKYFNHYETVLANRGLTDKQKDSSVLPEGYVYQKVTKMYGPHATEYVGVSSALILEASVHMILDLVDMDKLVDPTVVVEFTHNGESAKQHHVVYRIDDEEHPLIIDANGVARIVVDDLAAVDAQVTVHCSVYDGEATAENLLYTVDDSVESYCGWGVSTSDAELAAVCERIIKYSQSAKAYFNK
ncbi:MAG: hypothetical protein J6A53_09400, partial [Clostridia bacterium]|nr:hypothetical protein [Clostridia bacterium]